jgi:hypothetical protein
MEGVFAAELDTRSSSAPVPLVPVAGADFRVSPGGQIFVKEGVLLYEITL